MILEGYVSIIDGTWTKDIQIGHDTLMDWFKNNAYKLGGICAFDNSKTLGTHDLVIPDCKMNAYFTKSKCSLDVAIRSVYEHLYGTVCGKAEYTGYSEWTILGLYVDSLTIGGHDLFKEFESHIGEYVHLCINEDLV